MQSTSDTRNSSSARSTQRSEHTFNSNSFKAADSPGKCSTVGVVYSRVGIPPLLIHNRNVHNIDNGSEETSNITILFRSKLYDCAHTPIYLIPYRLRNPITTKEGLKRFTVRRNYPPLGTDHIPMELLNRSPPAVAFKLATSINHFVAP